MLIIDGIPLHPTNLCCGAFEGSEFVPKVPTKMSVKELRAELAARQYPLRGNKKELIKQLQKARVEAEVEGATYNNGKGAPTKKVGIRSRFES